MKITISQIKNSLDWINSILDSAKEKMYEPEDPAKKKKKIWNKAQRGRKRKVEKNNTAPVTNGTVSSCTHNLSFRKETKGGQKVFEKKDQNVSQTDKNYKHI